MAHAVFKRNEPTPPQFLTLAALIPTLSATVLHQPILSSLLYLCIFLASLTTSILYYRLLSPSHPLAKVPGPLLARATQLWIFRVVYLGQTRRVIQELHQKYGEVVRIGPNEISVFNVPAITTIHGSKSWIKGVSYDASMTSNPVPEDTSMISLRPSESVSEVMVLVLTPHLVEVHAVRRKVYVDCRLADHVADLSARSWDRAFAMQSLADYQAVIHTRVGQLCTQFDARAGQEIDLHTWLGFL